MNLPALRNILCVEDDPDIQMIARLALEAVGGFVVRACGSGREALTMVDGEFLPDLLLLDVMMPEMDGPATLAHLRCDPRMERIPVIFMTAKVQAGEMALYRALGAIGVIAKPFDPMQLPADVRRMWEARQAA